MYFMLILVSGAKMQLPLQLGVTDRQTDKQTYSTTTVTLCACALRVNNVLDFSVLPTYAKAAKYLAICASTSHDKYLINVQYFQVYIAS